MPPVRYKSTDLSRDERFRIKVLCEAGFTQKEVARRTGATIRQIQYVNQHQTTPRRRSGRPPTLTDAQIEELIDFIRLSRTNRRMSYKSLAKAMDWGVSEHVIRQALEKHGFHRRIALRKPPISEKNRRLRLQWATEYLNWTREQWDSILWTDETWVTAG